MQFSISRRSKPTWGIRSLAWLCVCRMPAAFAAFVCVSIFAINCERATAQGGGGFSSHYGTDATHAAAGTKSYSYGSSKKDPPYQSHFGSSKPAGHQAVTAPASYEYGMDADSLFAAGMAHGGQYPGGGYGQPGAFGQYGVQMAAAQSFAPFVYYVVPDTTMQQPMTDPVAQDGAAMFASLAPGVQWQTDFASVQDEEEIDPLPPRVGTADGEAPTFGQQQEQAVEQIDQAPLTFLRAQSILLDPGERQIDIGMQYAIADGFVLNALSDASPPAGDDIALTLRARQRLLLVPLAVRYGLTENVQLFYNLPFGWSNAELAIPGAFDEWSNRAGIGDVNAGATLLVYDGCGSGPNILTTFAFTAPTGNADFFVAGLAPNSRLGEGFWAVSSQVLVTHTMDPCVLFYSLGYRHRFDANFNAGPRLPGRIRVNPGEQFIYQLGVGFAANDSVTFSTSFVGAYITEDQIDGRRIQGGITEPMRLRFAATIAKPCKIVEPFAEIGMTRDAANSRFGITWTY